MNTVPPRPKPRTHDGEITSRARTEALAMTCAVPGHTHHRLGDVAAAALRTHSALSAGLGQGIPLTGLGPDGGGVRGLTAFLAVYARQHEQQDTPGLTTAA